jgi:hypothetical protein
VANRVGNFFITENLREREQEANGTSQFLESQLETAKTNLQEQEAKLREFKVTYNGELPEQELGMLAANGQNKAELLGIQDSIGRATEQAHPNEFAGDGRGQREPAARSGPAERGAGFVFQCGGRARAACPAGAARGAAARSRGDRHSPAALPRWLLGNPGSAAETGRAGEGCNRRSGRERGRYPGV